MAENKKELMLRLPESIFKIIKNFKEKSGVSYTNFIYNAIVWYAVHKGLINLDYVRMKIENEVKKND